MFSACTTALAESDASLRVVTVFSRGSGGTSVNPAYALDMCHAFFHRVLSWALCTIWLKARCGGTSMKMLPGDCSLN